ncbi:hypothetical protein TRIUR3_09763 [Triticum urartu]|uniref:Uncharacterized protein n=1 Tax=Triticum urartu TaxID=4572 RepID=M8A6G3_TRIUA|nr:hypothetical protein TRIUR3_09763 [Triticum urartu]
MDFIPGVDGPSEGVPRVLACFSNENPARANGHIFNVGNPDNEVTVRELAEMMTEVYAKVSGEPPQEEPVIDVSAKEFYGEGYDDSDKRIPDMTLINKQLGVHITPRNTVFVLPFIIHICKLPTERNGVAPTLPPHHLLGVQTTSWCASLLSGLSKEN